MSNSPPNRAMVRCEQLVKFYDTSTARVQAVRGIDLEVSAGVQAAIVGPSGSGKTSLLRMLAGLDRPTAGRVLIDGADIWQLNERDRARALADLITHIYSHPADNLYSHLTARMQLERAARGGPEGVDQHGRATLVDDWLAALQLAHRGAHVPSEMSGGERQRLAFARAAVAGHRLILADEPTSELDSLNASAVLDGVGELAAHGITVLVATHDRRVLERMDHVITLRDGVVASVTTGDSEEAVIDTSGRLQLPPAVHALFPDGRVRFVVQPGEDVRLERP